jgi:hypothetical protein
MKRRIYTVLTQPCPDAVSSKDFCGEFCPFTVDVSPFKDDLVFCSVEKAGKIIRFPGCTPSTSTERNNIYWTELRDRKGLLVSRQ